MAKLIGHESKYRHFGAAANRSTASTAATVCASSTNPRPSYEEVWNWQRHIDAGLRLYAEHLGRPSATWRRTSAATPTTSSRETVCRWNGGAYRQWDAKAGAWVRPATMLCDSKTGNIGWRTTDPENAGKTETELHDRDAGSYSAPPGKDAHWKYSGICYADSVLG